MLCNLKIYYLKDFKYTEKFISLHLICLDNIVLSLQTIYNDFLLSILFIINSAKIIDFLIINIKNIVVSMLNLKKTNDELKNTILNQKL